MEMVLSLCVGIGLAAACGFRVFVPLAVMSVGARAGLIEPGAGWEWIGSWWAISALGVACVVEVAAYYVPWVDNALDSVATPAAVVAGTLAAASQIHGMDPMLAWSAAAIAGGGTAGAVQTATVATRGASTASTGGLMNWLVASVENAAAGVLAVLSVVAPVVAGLAIFAGAILIARAIRRRLRARHAARGAASSGETGAWLNSASNSFSSVTENRDGAVISMPMTRPSAA